MTNLERIAPLRINGAPAETWRTLGDARLTVATRRTGPGRPQTRGAIIIKERSHFLIPARGEGEENEEEDV